MGLVDGFTYNATVVEQPQQWPWLAVRRLRQTIPDPSRWRPRLYVVPVSGAEVAATSDHIEQLAIVPGSVLWGVRFIALSGTAADFLAQISFDFERQNLFSNPVVATALASGRDRLPVLLAEPKALAGSAVSVRVWNSANSARRYQVLLFCAEPWGGNHAQ